MVLTIPGITGTIFHLSAFVMAAFNCQHTSIWYAPLLPGPPQLFRHNLMCLMHMCTARPSSCCCPVLRGAPPYTSRTSAPL